jgi:hypothetical protein
MEGTVKLTVNVPKGSIGMLKKYACAHRTTLTEALRRALGLQDFLGKHVSKGGKVLIEHPDGKLVQLIDL